MKSPRRPLRRRGVALLLLALAVLTATLVVPSPTPAAAALRDGRSATAHAERGTHSGSAPPRDVVVVGAPGLSWSDVSREDTPALHSFASKAAITNLNVRSTYFTSCPSDGWLGLSAGTRAAEPRDVTREELRANPRALPSCSPLPQITSGPALTAVDVDPDYWRDLSERIADQGFDARIGTLGQTVADAGGCIAGSGDGAVLAMPDHDGQVPSGRPGIDESCAVTLVGAPAITVPGADGTVGEAAKGEVRAGQVAAVDAVVDDVVAATDSDTVIILAGLSDDGGKPGLRVLAMAGSGIRPGWLHSDSTTRDEMAQLADVTHTVLTTAGMTPPPGVVGRALVPVRDDAPVDERIASLVDDAAQLEAADEVIPPFFRGFAFGLVALLAAAGLLWRFGPRARRPLVATATGLVGLVAMALPASTYLVTRTRWFDAASPLAGFVPRIVVIDLAIVAVTLAGLIAVRRRGALASPFAPALVPVGLVAGLTWLVLAGDLLLAGRMTMLSVLGLLPLDGGRFHGFGNVPFAIFVAAAFLLMTAVASPLLAAGRRRAAVVAVAVIGAATFLVDAWLGADGGGALALIPSVGYLVLAVAGVRLSWVKVVGIALATGLGFLAMAGADWLRPEEQRTHLGRFFQRMLDGEAWGIVVRKLQTNIDLLLGPERAALLVPVVLIAVIWVLARPDGVVGQRLRPVLDAHPGLRIGLTALVVALTVGFLLNDSGTAIPAAAALVLGPALVVLWVGSRTAPREGRSEIRAS